MKNKAMIHHFTPTRQIRARLSNSRSPPFRPSIMTSTIAARLELSAPSCIHAGESSPVATMSAGAKPKIMARTSRDIAGYFFTNVDIFFFSISSDRLAGRS